MKRLALILLAGLGAGCAGPKPFLIDGDANSAEVGYSSTPANTDALARAHCARYERVPQFLQAEQNVAYFSCVRP